MSNTYDLVKLAILQRKQVTAVYEGRYRELCPHQLGTNKRGEAQCLFYQFGGESNSGVIVDGAEGNWRCLSLDGLSEIALRDGDWHSASNYVNPSSCLADVEVCVVVQPATDEGQSQGCA